jgi:hypothetical protein
MRAYGTWHEKEIPESRDCSFRLRKSDTRILERGGGSPSIPRAILLPAEPVAALSMRDVSRMKIRDVAARDFGRLDVWFDRKRTDRR